jgi:hypothetical protein
VTASLAPATAAPAALARRGVAPRVALVAGTLGQGGAEKQLVYGARALAEAGVHVRVYSLTEGEWYAAELAAHGLAPTWVGRARNPAARVLALVRALAGFRPHLVQAGHFFTNLYVAGAATAVGAVAVGGMREDPRWGMAQNGRWGPLLLRAPRAIVANSEAARGWGRGSPSASGGLARPGSPCSRPAPPSSSPPSVRPPRISASS